MTHNKKLTMNHRFLLAVSLTAAAFDYAYKFSAIRSWLFAQSK